MSQADNAIREQPNEDVANASSGPPKICESCSGQQPRPGLDLEDMTLPNQGNRQLEKLIRKASIAQQMLADVLKQLTRQQTQNAAEPKHMANLDKRKSNKVSAKSRNGQHHYRHLRNDLRLSSSDSSENDCELIAVELEPVMTRRHMAKHSHSDRKRERSRSGCRCRFRDRSRCRSRGRSRSRSRTHTAGLPTF